MHGNGLLEAVMLPIFFSEAVDPVQAAESLSGHLYREFSSVASDLNLA